MGMVSRWYVGRASMNRTVMVHDLDVHFEEYGSENSLTILCIHGYPGRPQDFRWIIPSLDKYRLIVLAMPGLDITPLPEAELFSVSSRAEFVIDFMNTIHIESCVLLAHSMGGVIGAHIASHHKERVTQIIFISAVGPKPYRAYRRSRPDIGHLVFSKPPLKYVRKPLVRFLFGVFGFPKGVSTQAMFYVIACGAKLSFPEHRQNLSLLKQPVLSIWCQDDPLMEPESFDSLNKILRQCENYSFVSGGHSPQKKHATKVAQKIVQFIESNSP